MGSLSMKLNILHSNGVCFPRHRHHRVHSKVRCKAFAGNCDSSRTLGERSRRALLLGTLPIGLGACVEILSCPDVVQPYKNRKEIRTRKEQAVKVLETANEAYGNGKYSEAVDLYSVVIRMAPRSYVLCMKALLGRRDAYLQLGLNKKASSDARREFGWGRGIRWPGWYIISAIVIRNQFMDD